MKHSPVNLALTILLTLAPAISTPAAQAANPASLSPEVVARVWQEDDAELASVCLNGKDLLCFRGDSSGAAADKAEDLAAKLQEILEEKKFEPGDLMPAKIGTMAAIQVDGNTILSFESAGTSDTSKESGLEVSWRVVNGIRAAYGAPVLPPSLLKLAEQMLDSKNQSGCFSGHASWYGPRFHGRKTSDGSRFDQEKLTAAHRSLPFGTKLLVMNRKTGHSCVVKINDRGPFVGDRIIDLSKGAARQLKMLSSGVAVVDCLVLGNE